MKLLFPFALANCRSEVFAATATLAATPIWGTALVAARVFQKSPQRAKNANDLPILGYS